MPHHADPSSVYLSLPATTYTSPSQFTLDVVFHLLSVDAFNRIGSSLYSRHDTHPRERERRATLCVWGGALCPALFLVGGTNFSTPTTLFTRLSGTRQVSPSLLRTRANINASSSSAGSRRRQRMLGGPKSSLSLLWAQLVSTTRWTSFRSPRTSPSSRPLIFSPVQNLPVRHIFVESVRITGWRARNCPIRPLFSCTHRNKEVRVKK